MADAYCPNCESEVSLVETVDWQLDVCEACGNTIPDE